MNLLGKICVVAIVALSLIFMTFAMAVYATHKNWYLAVTEQGGLDDQLQAARTENSQLQEQYNRLKSNLEAELAQRAQRLAKLETERNQLAQQSAEIHQSVEKLREDLRTATMTVTATQQQNERLDGQVDGLQAEITQERTSRDQLFAAAKSATEELQQKLGDLARTMERNRQLVPLVAKYENWLREKYSENPRSEVDIIPDVDGVIRDVRRVGARHLIEISIGSDDGIKRGHELTIHRAGKYLGKARVQSTDPDVATAEITRTDGNIREGDDVTTRIRLS